MISRVKLVAMSNIYMQHVKVMIVRRTNYISYSSFIRKSIIDKYLFTYFFYFFNITFSLGPPFPPKNQKRSEGVILILKKDFKDCINYRGNTLKVIYPKYSQFY